MMKQCTVLVTILLLVFINMLHSDSFNHAHLDSVFQLYVHDGRVDYEGIKVLPRLLDTYIKQVSRVKKDEFESWTMNEQKAFWINVYNAFFIKTIVKNYPIQWGNIIAQARYPKNSINQIKNFHRKMLGLRMVTLLNLKTLKEDILINQIQDPRIFFALCDGTIGSLLPDVAFSAGQLDEQLEQHVNLFLSDPQKLKIDPDKNKLYLSYVFKENIHSFPIPGENLDDEFKADTLQKIDPEIPQLEISIASLKSEIEAMRALTANDSGMNNASLSANYVSTDTVETTGAVNGDSVSNERTKPADENKLDHQESIKFKEQELEKLEAALNNRAAFAANGREQKRLSEYRKDYHGIIHFLMRHLPADKRNYLLNYHPKIKFFSKNVLLNDVEK